MDLLGKVLALSSALLWAVAVILFKRAGDTIRPVALNWYKTAVTAVLMLPALFLCDTSGLTQGDLWKITASGILGIAVSDTLLFIALEKLGASLTAIVDCFYAPFVMLASWLMLSQAPRVTQIFGAAAVIGALLVVSMEKRRVEDHIERRRKLTGFAAGAAAMAVMGVSITLMQPVLARHSVWVVTELRILTSLVVLSAMMLQRQDRRDLFTSLVGRGAWKHALPATLIGNVLAMTLWVAAFKYTAVNSAAILNQTSTFFIVTLATWILKEPFTRHRLAGTVLAFSGAVVILIG